MVLSAKKGYDMPLKSMLQLKKLINEKVENSTNPRGPNCRAVHSVYGRGESTGMLK